MPVVSRLASIPLRIAEIAFGAVCLLHPVAFHKFDSNLIRSSLASSATSFTSTMRFSPGLKVAGFTPKSLPAFLYFSA